MPSGMITGTAPAKPTRRRPPRRRRVDGRPNQPLHPGVAGEDANLMMRSLGRPNREQVVTTRPEHARRRSRRSTCRTARSSPTCSARGAANLLTAQSGRQRPALVELALSCEALCRQPTAGELRRPRVARRAGDADGLADLLWAVVMLPEFQLIVDEPRPNGRVTQADRRSVIRNEPHRRDFLRGMTRRRAGDVALAASRDVFAADEPAPASAGRRPTPASCSGWPAAWRRPRRSIPSATRRSRSACPSSRILCTFPAIDTAVDNIKISAGTGKHRRGHGSGDADPLARRRRSGQHPALAASVSLAHRLRAAADGGRSASRLVDRRSRGPNNPAIPPFINIGQRLEGVGESEELKAFTTGGFFGSEYGPFNLPFPSDAVAAVRPPKGMTPRAIRGPRSEPFKRVAQAAAPSAKWRATIIRSRCCARIDNAHRLLSSPGARRLRPDPGAEGSLDHYNTGRFGLGCLLARRLDRGRGPVHRGDDRVRAVPPLGHARERPHHARSG